MASRVASLPEYVQRANDYRAITGEGVASPYPCPYLYPYPYPYPYSYLYPSPYPYP